MVIHVARLRRRRADNVSIFFFVSSVFDVVRHWDHGFPVRVDVHPSVARYAHMDAVVW